MENFLSIAVAVFFTLFNVNEEGVVITHTDSISGDVSVNLERNEVVLRNGREYKHLYARDVKKILLKAEGKAYVSAPFGLNEEYFLFELLSEGGRAQLLYREGMKLSRYDETTYPPYFIKIGPSVYSFGGDKKQVFEIMDAFKSEIKDFIKDKNISLDSRSDLIKLFDYYNQL